MSVEILVLAAVLYAQSDGQMPGVAADPAASSPVLRRLVRSLAPRNVSRTPERNEWNPRLSPDGRRLGFERRDGSAQALFLAELATLDAPPRRVTSLPPQAPLSAEDALLGLERPDDSFNAQLSFYPDGGRFVFTGNANTGIYRLYEGTPESGSATAITPASKEDGHPAVSPDGRLLVYVSAREGIGKLVLRDLTTGAERPLTKGGSVDLFPAWAPDSRRLAFTSGENDNHDVFLIPDVTAVSPVTLQLTTWRFDDLRPVFSPDGSLLAFYTNYNPSGEEKEWSIVAIPADGTGPTKGGALAQRTVATNVTKDIEVGPAWLPGGQGLIYARNLKAEWNPVFAVDVMTREELRIETVTRMNHDLTCSAHGLVAWRAQLESWDEIFVATLTREP